MISAVLLALSWPPRALLRSGRLGRSGACPIRDAIQRKARGREIRGVHPAKDTESGPEIGRHAGNPTGERRSPGCHCIPRRAAPIKAQVLPWHPAARDSETDASPGVHPGTQTMASSSDICSHRAPRPRRTEAAGPCPGRSTAGSHVKCQQITWDERPPMVIALGDCGAYLAWGAKTRGFGYPEKRSSTSTADPQRLMPIHSRAASHSSGIGASHRI